jgi:hypothetical protein
MNTIRLTPDQVAIRQNRDGSFELEVLDPVMLGKQLGAVPGLLQAVADGLTEYLDFKMAMGDFDFSLPEGRD